MNLDFKSVFVLKAVKKEKKWDNELDWHHPQVAIWIALL